MLTVELRKILFHSFHGLYAGEPAAGGDFEVDLLVTYDETGHDLSTLNDTVNYVRLYEIVKKRMQQPTQLLEKICEDIIAEIGAEFPFVLETTLSIYKLQAPVENFQGRLGVTLSKKYPLR